MEKGPVKAEKSSKVPILWRVYDDDEEMRNHREKARKKTEKLQIKYRRKIEKHCRRI